MKVIIRALNHRNYRLFFSGQSISLIGTWMQRTAMSWLVYRLTDSALLLGLVGFVGQIPIFLFTPFAGVLADRLNRRRILIATQILAMLQAFILAFLVLTDLVVVWHLILLNIFLGFVDAVDTPVRQSFVIDMVERREDLGNAIALNSSMVNSAQLVGPSIAGLMIGAMGEGLCFLLNALSYLAVIASLFAMKMTPKETEFSRTRILEGLKEGVSYAFGFRPIRFLLLLIALVSLMGIPYMVLMPIFARDILHGGPHTLGFLMGSTGVGALVGGVYLASRKTVLGLERWMSLATGTLGVSLIAFSLSRVFWLSLFLMFLAGFGLAVQIGAGNTVVQTLVDEDKRGRVMSIYVMAFRGMMTFGSLLAGGLASMIGAPNTLIIGGTSCILGSLMFAQKLPVLRQMARPIYVKMGIISK